MENSIGLWEKTSQKGNIYYAGKIEIEGKKYIVNLFKVDKQENPKRPDYRMVLNEVKEQKTEEVKIEPSKRIEEKAEQVFVDFGNSTINDEDIAF